MTVTEPPIASTDVADAPPGGALVREEGRWTHQWAELYSEVITTGLCTGCSGCVIACPHDVIGYEHKEGGYKPFHLEDELGPADCTHGQKGCTSCTRACPRFRDWEPTADEHLFGRIREKDELYGIAEQVVLVRAADDDVHQQGQDGGLVSAILIWLLDEGYIDGALVSYLEGDGSSWRAKPGVATNAQEVLDAAGSRYTYSANLLAFDEAKERGLEKLALVGMGCQTSSPPVMWSRKVGKVAKPILFNIGLLCSKTFDDRIFEELFEAKYGITRDQIKKVNIKGVFQIWTHDGGYHEIPLKECHAWTREGCMNCPDFAAEHADISTGGIGQFADWTLTVVRTELGKAVMERMEAAGRIVTRPAPEDDPDAIKLMKRLSRNSRNRWPETAIGYPKLMPPPPPKKKKDPGPPPDAVAIAPVDEAKADPASAAEGSGSSAAPQPEGSAAQDTPPSTGPAPT